MRPLIKHTIIIWSETHLQHAELDQLAREATDGDAYCSKQEHERVEDPERDPDWDGTEFFGVDDEPEED